jgi:hypothetical protein
MSRRQDAVESFSPEMLRLPVMPVSNSVIKALRAPFTVEDCIEVPEVLTLVELVDEINGTMRIPGMELRMVQAVLPFLAAMKRKPT